MTLEQSLFAILPNAIKYYRYFLLCLIILLSFFINTSFSKAQELNSPDSTAHEANYVVPNTTPILKNMSFLHQLGLDYRLGHVIASKPFYKTDHPPELSLGYVQSAHLKYGFALPEGSLGSQIFPNTYQGIGIAIFDFGNTKEIGTPIAFYLFQKSPIASFSSRLSLNYEWNFGLSTGWQPYNPETNPNNIIVGSKLNAYINLGASLKWQMSKHFALNTGVDFTHFSNGNTEYPNAGVDIPGFKIGVAYDVKGNRQNDQKDPYSITPEATKHISYDVVVFGSWRRKGVNYFNQQIPSPQKYPVLGGYFAPMYNVANRLRTGLSLDFIYDGSANVYTEDYIVGTQQEFFKPEWNKQIAMGASARIDYVMPFFTIAAGIGANMFHSGGDFKGTYQSFALKIATTRSSFIHIGYNIKDFHEPNYLMLGLGYKFNNKSPSLLSR